jgi:hypothetical protein
VFYHLSGLRHNTVEWLPITKSDKVLEIGAGCGAITGVLSAKAGEVVGVDLSDIRSQINAHRHADRDNIILHVGNFKDIEPDLPTDFDYILLIGVFEYSCLYMDGDRPYEEMLRIMRGHLKADGHLIIAIENKFGLKYWAGCSEDHLGTFFSGIEGYPDGGSARTFTRNGLERLLRAGGIDEYTFYYPYPDYKFMTTLYSDERLPAKGELTDNIRNFDRDRLVLFNEKRVFDGIIEDGRFSEFANSYIVVTGKRPAADYVRYSNDRAPEVAIKTVITGGIAPTVIKAPLFPEGAGHVLRMEATYQRLCERYDGSGLKINRCKKSADGLGMTFEYVKGTTLAEQLDRCLESGDHERFGRLFDRFWEYVSFVPGGTPTGTQTGWTNYDFIFSNIMIADDDQESWTLIDYEWIMEKELAPTAIAFRAVYCYLLEDDSRNCLDVDKIFAGIGITAEMAEEYRDNERRFQKQVSGKRLSAGEIRMAIGTRQIDPRTMIKSLMDRSPGRRVQVYFDRGSGFSEAESLLVPEAYLTDSNVRVAITVDGNVKALRLDPADSACAVKIKQILWNGSKLQPTKRLIGVNGRSVGEGYYIFATADPNISLTIDRLERTANDRLLVELEVALLSEEMATVMAGAVRKIF